MEATNIELDHINDSRSRDSSTHSTNSRSAFENSDQTKIDYKGKKSIRPYWKKIPWLFEIASWIASLAFFTGIIVVLKVFDGQALPKLPLNISLNAIVGLLATLGEVLLMAPVASAIGQIKWLRALKRRPMSEFRLVDEASRGPWGGFLLLARTKGGILASIGSVITILALGTSTFVQQALKYETFYPTDGSALMPTAQYLNGTGWGVENGNNGAALLGIDQGMISALYTGLYSPPATKFTATPQCSTGNCTWPSYQTLAFCNTCKDITSKLNHTKVHITPANKVEDPYDTDFYTLPNGFSLTGVQPAPASLGNDDIPSIAMMNITISEGWLQEPIVPSIAFASNGSILISVIAIGPSPGTVPSQPSYDLHERPQSPPVAFECALQFCVANISASFSNGLLNETISSTWTNEGLKGLGQSGGHNDIHLNPPFQPRKTFVIRNQALATGSWLKSWIVGNATLGATIGDSNSYLSNGKQIYSSDIMQAFYQSMNASANGLESAMDNLAHSMSLALRQLPYQPAPEKGVAHSSISFFVVRWPWLILPLVVLVLSLIFLIAVIVETKRKGFVPWNNNILATLFHGLGQQSGERALNDYQASMEEDAREYLLEFRDDGESGHLFANNRT